MIAIHISAEEFAYFQDVQIRPRAGWPAAFNCNERGDVWPFARYGHTGPMGNLRGQIPRLDEIVKVILAERPKVAPWEHVQGGRFFINNEGVFIKPEGVGYVQIAEFVIDRVNPGPVPLNTMEKRLEAIQRRYEEGYRMGTFNVTIGVGHLGGGDLAEVSAMVDTGVDTGAIHSIFLPLCWPGFAYSPMSHIGGPSPTAARWNTAMGWRVSPLAIKNCLCPVIFGPDDEYLSGATTLEIFGLVVDPVGQVLLPRVYLARPI